MKKRILSSLFSAIMLLCLFPTAAFAAGNLEGVDYTRISGSGSRVTLTLGSLEFEGQLSRGTLLSQSEQDQIIAKTMNDLELTSGMLINAKSLLDKANKLEGFNLKDVKNALFKLAGVENAVDLYNAVMGTGDKSAAQIAAGIAKDQGMDTAEDSLEAILTNGGKVALKGAGKFAFKLLFILPDLTEIGVAALTKYENIKETIAVAVERQVLLDTFYETCSKRISEASGDRGKWEIRFDKAKNYRTYSCTFWGISGVMISAELSGVLEQVSELDGYAGQYKGTIWIDFKGVDMAVVDSQFKKTDSTVSTFLNRWVSFNKMPEAGESSEPTVLERKTQGELSVMITLGAGAQTSDVSGSLTSGGDITDFSLKHEFRTYKAQPSLGEMTYTLSVTSSSPDSFTYVLEKWGTGQYSASWRDPTETREVSTDIGTVWKPLESKPVITVYH